MEIDREKTIQALTDYWRDYGVKRSGFGSLLNAFRTRKLSRRMNAAMEEIRHLQKNEQREILEEFAARMGFESYSEWMRQLALNSLDEMEKAGGVTDETRTVRRELEEGKDTSQF